MTAAAILDAVHAAGGRLSVRAGKLHVTAPRGALGSELQAQIAAHKAELLAAMAPIDPTSAAAVRAALEDAYQAAEADPADDAAYHRFVALLAAYKRDCDAARGTGA